MADTLSCAQLTPAKGLQVILQLPAASGPSYASQGAGVGEPSAAPRTTLSEAAPASPRPHTTIQNPLWSHLAPDSESGADI